MFVFLGTFISQGQTFLGNYFSDNLVISGKVITISVEKISLSRVLWETSDRNCSQMLAVTSTARL